MSDSSIERISHRADFEDLGFINGDSELLEWRKKYGLAWPGRGFFFAPNNSADVWNIDEAEFPRPIIEIFKRAAAYERRKRPDSLSRLYAALDIRFLGTGAITDTDVHFDDIRGKKDSDSLRVYLWSSEKSTSTTIFTGPLTFKDKKDFDGVELQPSDKVLETKTHLTALSPMPGRLIVTDRCVPHSSPQGLLRDNRSPRVFVRLHTWIEE